MGNRRTRHPRRLLTLQYGSFSRSGRSLINLRHQRIPKVAWQSDVSNLHQLSPYPAISRVCAESRAAFYAGNEICFSAAVAPRTLNCELGSLAGHGHTDIKTWRALPRDETTRSGFPFRAARDVVFLKAYWLKRRGEHELCSFMGVLERPDPDELQIENVRYLAAQCYTFSALLRMCLSRHILWLPCLEELIEVAPDDDALLPPHVKRDENWPAKVWLTRKTYTNNWISNVEKEFKNHSKDPKQIHIRASMPKLKLMTEGMLKMYMEVGDDEDKIVPFAELKFEQEGGGNKWYRLETSTFFEFMTC
jgi:hypothetical protein